MTETTEENYISVDAGIKSIPINQLEECIASAIAEVTNGSKLNCHITELETSGMLNGVTLKLSLYNDLSDVPL